MLWAAHFPLQNKQDQKRNPIDKVDGNCTTALCELEHFAGR